MLRFVRRSTSVSNKEPNGMSQLRFARYKRPYRLTHYLFRFPAKFHPPAIRCLIDRFSRAGDTILDPFCGSGTLLVEAVVAGRHAVGVDIDPVATFVSRVKSKPIDPTLLERRAKQLTKSVHSVRRSKRDYDGLMHRDLAESAVNRWREELQIPQIPNIAHWFRTYVILDLAKLRNAIREQLLEPEVRNFFLGCFASIIRNASNADPVPVSGLEVTAHMRRLDAAGRRIDPFALFDNQVARAINGMREFWDHRQDVSIRIARGDAATLRSTLEADDVDVVITSPPYNTAVDYYRRHMLEMYWLDFVQTHEDRIRLAQKYLGRDGVRQHNTRLKCEHDSDYVNRLISHARKISAHRERSVRHYCASMKQVLEHSAEALKKRGRAIFVVGNAKWNGKKVRATKLLIELAKPWFSVEESLSYTSQNRYMSYSRHNGADVNREHVIVFRKK